MSIIAETERQVNQAKVHFRSLAVLALIVLAAAAGAGYRLSVMYLAAAPLAVIPAAAAIWKYRHFKRLQSLLKLRKRWKNEITKDRDFSTIASLFRYLYSTDSCANMIDEQTWRDLNLDQVYALLDRTFTAEGQAVLYLFLRTPCLQRSTLEERNSLIKVLQKDTAWREKLQLALLPLERRNDMPNTDLLWGNLPPPSPLAPLYTALALTALLSLISPLLLGARGILVITMMFSLNTYVHHKVRKNIAHVLPSISSLASLLRAARTITGLEKREAARLLNTLRKSSAASERILKKTRLLYPNLFLTDLDLVYEYCKYFFLLEVRTFYSALNEIGRRIEHLRNIYLAVGELDALQAIASFRESRPGYSEPHLSSGRSPYYSVEGVHHPLLSNAVANSLPDTGRGILITGSNMSGKSTFLRTVGVTALLAQTIFTCPASSYRGSYFRIFTSISREDSLAEGKSFYFREAERLLKLINAAGENDGAPALCIIDELLSGTNYTERLAASEAILNYLAQKNALVIVATHDLDLAEKLQNSYACFHFSDRVEKDGLHFDFKLKKGLATTRNAIRLLAYLNYPASIVRQADRKATHIDSLAKQGKTKTNKVF